jgi:uncharacterized membrane protein
MNWKLIKTFFNHIEEKTSVRSRLKKWKPGEKTATWMEDFGDFVVNFMRRKRITPSKVIRGFITVVIPLIIFLSIGQSVLNSVMSSQNMTMSSEMKAVNGAMNILPIVVLLGIVLLILVSIFSIGSGRQ